MGWFSWKHPNPLINLSLTKSEQSDIVCHLIWLNRKFITPPLNYYIYPTTKIETESNQASRTDYWFTENRRNRGVS